MKPAAAGALEALPLPAITSAFSDIILDAEFRHLVPPPAPEELARMLDAVGDPDTPPTLIV